MVVMSSPMIRPVDSTSLADFQVSCKFVRRAAKLQRSFTENPRVRRRGKKWMSLCIVLPELQLRPIRPRQHAVTRNRFLTGAAQPDWGARSGNRGQIQFENSRASLLRYVRPSPSTDEQAYRRLLQYARTSAFSFFEPGEVPTLRFTARPAANWCNQPMSITGAS